MTDIYWEQNLWMIETFLFLRLGEEKVCWNVAEKLEKYWRQEATSLENVYLS